MTCHKQKSILFCATMFVKISLIIFWFSTLFAYSQDFLVSVGAGVASSDNSVFSDRLASYTPKDANGEPLVFKTGKFSNSGVVLQGSVLVDIHSLLLGANLEKVFFPKVLSINEQSIKQSEFVLGNTDISLSLGLPLYHIYGSLFYSFLQAGLSNYNLSFTNNHIVPIPFFEGEPVQPQATQGYDASGIRLGIGLAFNTRFSQNSSLIFGSKLLFGKMVSPAKWHQNGTEVKNGGNSPCNCGVTFTINVGLPFGRMFPLHHAG